MERINGRKRMRLTKEEWKFEKTLKIWQLNNDPRYHRYMILQVMKKFVFEENSDVQEIKCECCKVTFDITIDNVYKWQSKTELTDDMITIFCEKCLNHFNCPECVKTVKIKKSKFLKLRTIK